MNEAYISALLDALDPSAKSLRQSAAEAEARAAAAKRDGDHADAGRWARRALELKRRARAKEFAG